MANARSNFNNPFIRLCLPIIARPQLRYGESRKLSTPIATDRIPTQPVARLVPRAGHVGEHCRRATASNCWRTGSNGPDQPGMFRTVSTSRSIGTIWIAPQGQTASVWTSDFLFGNETQNPQPTHRSQSTSHHERSRGVSALQVICTIASAGQTSTHAPQLVQTSGSMIAKCPGILCRIGRFALGWLVISTVESVRCRQKRLTPLSRVRSVSLAIIRSRRTVHKTRCPQTSFWSTFQSTAENAHGTT